MLYVLNNREGGKMGGGINMSGHNNNKGDLQEFLALIAAAPAVIEGVNEILKSEVKLPNTPWKVKKNDRFWSTQAEYNGWCLQQNEFTLHCRIVDPDSYRRAWGTKNGMKKAFKELRDSVI